MNKYILYFAAVQLLMITYSLFNKRILTPTAGRVGAHQRQGKRKKERQGRRAKKRKGIEAQRVKLSTSSWATDALIGNGE